MSASEDSRRYILKHPDHSADHLGISGRGHAAGNVDIRNSAQGEASAPAPLGKRRS